MEKDAINSSKSKSKEKQTPSKDSANGFVSPLIFILIALSLIVLGLLFFKDKITRKPKNLDELVKDQKGEPEPEPEPEPKQETVTEEKANEISDKFAKKSGA